MHHKNLSLADKIHNENLNNSLDNLRKTDSKLKNELSQIESIGKKPIQTKYYIGAIVAPLLIMIGRIMIELADKTPRQHTIGETVLAIIFGLLFWVVYLGSYVATPIYIIMSIKELIRTPKRERYLELLRKIKNLEKEKIALKKKLKY